MKKIFVLVLCTISLSIVAADHLPFSASTSMPYSTMTSVNESTVMTTGSHYTPAVHAVGASSPAASAAPIAHAPSGPRRSGFNDITTGEAVGSEGVDSYDPQNTW